MASSDGGIVLDLGGWQRWSIVVNKYKFWER